MIKKKTTRKTIFDILSEDFDLKKEIGVIYNFLAVEPIVTIEDEVFTVIRFIDEHCFHWWMQRKYTRCISCADMMERLNIRAIVENPEPLIPEFIIFMEFVENMLSLFIRYVKKHNHQLMNSFKLLDENAETLLDHFNLTTYEIWEDEKVIIIEKNRAASAAAEVVDSDLAKDIVQYNHYLLKGEVEIKRDIITRLAKELEPKLGQLEKADEILADQLSVFFDNMNIKYNNTDPDDKNFVKHTAKMDAIEVEEVYDEIYQMILLALLLLEHTEREKYVKELMSHFKKKKR
jgi:hypothetical protein